MLIKQRHYNGGWRYLDNVARVEDAGLVRHPDHPDSCKAFQSERELHDFIEQVYGPFGLREFVAEWYPVFPSDDHPHPLHPARANHDDGVFDSYTVRLVTAWLRDGAAALIVTGQETYLCADNGDTIERL